MGTVSWTAVARADMYLATATGDDGHTHTCSSNSTDCSFTDLHCAETYAVTVVTMDRGCRSDPSPDVELRTGEKRQSLSVCDEYLVDLELDYILHNLSWTDARNIERYRSISQQTVG